jgi:hypothetical protein
LITFNLALGKRPCKHLHTQGICIVKARVI